MFTQAGNQIEKVVNSPYAWSPSKENNSSDLTLRAEGMQKITHWLFKNSQMRRDTESKQQER